MTITLSSHHRSGGTVWNIVEEAVDDVLLGLGRTDPEAIQDLRHVGVLSGGVDDELRRHHVEFVTVPGDGDTDDGVTAAVVDQVGDLGVIAEGDPRFGVERRRTHH